MYCDNGNAIYLCESIYFTIDYPLARNNLLKYEGGHLDI